LLKVAIVILNWNGLEFLRKFLPKLIECIPSYSRIIIADNDSFDGSIDFLKKEFPFIRVIRNISNGGFAKGYNDALFQVEAEYFVLLNSDIEVTSNWIEPIISLMESDEKIGACQPKLRSWYHRDSFEYAGAAGGYIDKFGYPFCRGRIFQHIEKDTGQYDDIAEIFWATGAALFVRADLYKKLGGLNQEFFAHMEEIDFCWRLKNAGYKILYCPQSVVYHVGGGTLPKKSSFKTYLNFRNNLSLLYRNVPRKGVYLVFSVRFFLDGIAALKFLFEGGFADFYAVFRAHVYFYKNISRLKNERKKLIQGNVSKIFQRNLVIEYYLKRKQLFSQLNPSRFS
jgi:GT2 family glycosyltransferase